MAYDEGLAQRVLNTLAGMDGVVERKMFGGLAVMLKGNMAVGIMGDRLMVRVGRDGYDEALRRPHCGPMDITGRPMKGFVVVEAEGIASDAGLEEWVGRGVGFALTLPPK